MPIDETGLITVIKARTTGHFTFVEATYNRIAEDAVYFMNQMINTEIRESDKNRSARMVLLLMAFYIESISRALRETPETKNFRSIVKREGWPKYFRGFPIVYRKLCNKRLQLNIDGIDDIFLIRNKVLAHPWGYTRREEDGALIINPESDSTLASYAKFRKFPKSYTEFNVSHTVLVLNEVISILKKYHNLIKRETTDKKLLDSCWPAGLILWKKKNRA